jgi:hypothetical protein
MPGLASQWSPFRISSFLGASSYAEQQNDSDSEDSQLEKPPSSKVRSGGYRIFVGFVMDRRVAGSSIPRVQERARNMLAIHLSNPDICFMANLFDPVVANVGEFHRQKTAMLPLIQPRKKAFASRTVAPVVVSEIRHCGPNSTLIFEIGHVTNERVKFSLQQHSHTRFFLGQTRVWYAKRIG